MENVVSGSGMGTSDLIGQVGTLVAMGSSDRVLARHCPVALSSARAVDPDLRPSPA